LVNNTGGGGVTDHGYLVLYFTKEPNLKEVKIGPIKRISFVFFLQYNFYLPLFNSVTKKIPRLKKCFGGHLPALAPLSYAYEQ
jgi:hypothetical protein